MSLLLSPRVGGPVRRAVRRPEALINRVDALNNMTVLGRQAWKTGAFVALAMALVRHGVLRRDKPTRPRAPRRRRRRAPATDARLAPAAGPRRCPRTARETPPAGARGRRAARAPRGRAAPPQPAAGRPPGHPARGQRPRLRDAGRVPRRRLPPALAESWEESPDGLRLLLHVRAGVRWHDGHALSPVDVQASLEPLLRSSSRQPALRALLSDVEAVEVMPDRVVRLRLARPSRLVLRALCEVPILPAEACAGRRPQASRSWAASRSGPGPSAWPPGSAASASAWSRHGAAGRRPASTSTRSSSRSTATARGPWPAPAAASSTCCRACSTSTTPTRSRRAPCARRWRSTGSTPERCSFLVVNHHRPLLADARVRRALALLWNRGPAGRGVAPRAGPAHRRAPFGAARAARPSIGRPPQRLLDEAGLRDSQRRRRARAAAGAHPADHAAGGGRARRRHRGARLRRSTCGGRGCCWSRSPSIAAALLARLKQGDFDLAPMLWEGRPDDDPRSLFGPQGELAFTGYRSAARWTPCSISCGWPTAPRPARPLLRPDRRAPWPPSSR